jgi:hypothetical protein
MGASIIGETLKGKFNAILVEEEALTISYKALYFGFKGDKRIPYASITSIQFREPGTWLAGYLQFSIKGGIEWQGAVNQDENAIIFDAPGDDFRALRDFVQGKLEAPSTAESVTSVADELSKLAKLRDQGILTDEEFAAQKAKLLA